MSYLRHESDQQKSGAPHNQQDWQQRATARSERGSFRPTQSDAEEKMSPDDNDKPLSGWHEECTLDHKHDEHCRHNRDQKVVGKSGNKSSSTTNQQRHGSVMSPYSINTSVEIPDMTTDIDSDTRD